MFIRTTLSSTPASTSSELSAKKALISARQGRWGLLLGLILVAQLLLGLASGPTVRAASASFKFDKDAGETGSPLVLRGSGYDPNSLISIEVVQPNKPGAYPSERVYRLGLTTSDSKGEWLWQGVVPGSYAFTDDGTSTAPPQTAQFNGPLPLEATKIDFVTETLPGARLIYSEVEQKARGSFNVTANNSKGPRLFNTAGSLDDNSFIEQLWNPLDLPVVTGRAAVKRGFIWGPRPFYAAYEPYTEGSQNGYRPVIYFDKSRMENTTAKEPPLLTNGLLVVEMVSGRTQLGNGNFTEGQPSPVYAAGDLGVNVGPRFSTFKPLLTVNTNKDGTLVNATLDIKGAVQPNPEYDTYGVKTVNYIKETNHFVASIFLDYLNQKGTIATLSGRPPTYSYGKNDSLFTPTFFATGYPVTEPYWATVTVGGQPRLVLIQLFERRVLTYTPTNPDGFKVEMGNVGLQYWAWRYNR